LRLGRHIEQLGDVDPNGRCLLYQLSTGSPAAWIFSRRSEPKLVNYHNITPAEFFEPWEPDVADELRAGRHQMERLAACCSFAIADSVFNQRELDRAGYRDTAVCPPLIDYGRGSEPAAPAPSGDRTRDRAAGGSVLLFVGKIAPHKADHDLVKALDAYRTLYDPHARLRLVGAELGVRYPGALRQFADQLGILGAVEFAGSVSDAELDAAYRGADVFVCLSDHEGFCVPLVEAMAHGLPVVAYAAGAVAETVGDAGIILAEKGPVHVATAIDRVLRDPSLQRSLADVAARRVLALALARSSARARDVIRQAVVAVSQPGGEGGSIEHPSSKSRDAVTP
jgi:glycosyltransferase involved in cell wall biosynthesis